ncbi:hypothetical protein PMI17_01372 [Pantoea sp. GM01]|nr:hypothetical protein PMI17_01372 [Pantoea sp. GM01]
MENLTGNMKLCLREQDIIVLFIKAVVEMVSVLMRMLMLTIPIVMIVFGSDVVFAI